jgi:hypothetical protein
MTTTSDRLLVGATRAKYSQMRKDGYILDDSDASLIKAFAGTGHPEKLARLAIQMRNDGILGLICETCNGDGCETCNGRGWVA